MNKGFLLNLISGVRSLLSYHGSDSHEVSIWINKGKPDKVSFLGRFQATPEFLNDFVDLCMKHFDKEDSNG